MRAQDSGTVAGAPAHRAVWTIPSARGQVDLAVEAAPDGRWRYSVLRHRGDRVVPLSQGVASSWELTVVEITSALDRAGVAGRPADLYT